MGAQGDKETECGGEASRPRTWCDPTSKQQASSTTSLRGGRGYVFPEVCSPQIGTWPSTALLGRPKPQTPSDTLWKPSKPTKWVRLREQGISHTRTRSVVSRRMSEEVSHNMQVAQPATPTTTPISAHHPTTAPSPPTQHIPTHHSASPPHTHLPARVVHMPHEGMVKMGLIRCLSFPMIF